MSWPIAPLREVAEIRGGAPSKQRPGKHLSRVTDREAASIRGGATSSAAPPTDRDGVVPGLTPWDLPLPGTGIREVRPTRGHIPHDAMASGSRDLLPAGAVLFSSRGRIGRVGIAGVPLAVQPGVTGLVPNPNTDPRFLAWCLAHFRQQIATLAGPGPFGEVAIAALGRFPIPVPPIAEQRRIAKVLDRADQLRQLHAQSAARIDRLLPALFLDYFGDPAFNRKGWPTARLGDLCEVVGAFSQGDPNTEDLGGAGPREAWVTAGDLSSSGNWVLGDPSGSQGDTCRHYPARTAARIAGSALQIPEGAVLFASRAPLGRAAITGVPVHLSQEVLALVGGPRLDPWYLFAWCRLRGRLLHSFGNGPGHERVSPQAVEDLILAVPPLADQRRFRTVLEKLRLLRLRALAAEQHRRSLARLLALRAFSRTAREAEAPNRLAPRGASPTGQTGTPAQAIIAANPRTAT